MGGQACILYGAAEFSRDVDVAVAVDPANLARLRAALADLEAEPVYFPQLSATALRRGHACHFRCGGDGLSGVRLDVMAVLRGVAGFESLWRRRVRLELPGRIVVDVMGLEDLVRAKKTQRDKDWPMVRRLVESDVARAPARVAATRARFWLRECRTPELLVALARRFPRPAAREARVRPAVRGALAGDIAAVERALRVEEDREREADRRYWAPLRVELERLRLGRHGPG
jgi:hypothetical protein